ncbi:hypothetical protein [Roseococcus sp.]|uniref:hypothetical protein n=1 Tax=Roseococcus sp. TaxID=2109646 RepID=UPI003BAA2B1B
MTPDTQRKLPIDPAWIALAAAAVVLIGVSAWLTQSRPASERPAEHRAEPAVVVPNPLEARIAELAARLAASEAATEAALAQLRARPTGDPAAVAALNQRIEQGRAAASQALDGRVKSLEDALTQRLGEGQAALGRRIEAMEQAASQRAAADQAEVRRLEALERSAAERAAGELALGRRVEAIDQTATQRAAQFEQTLSQRLAAVEQSTTERVAPIQDALRRLGANEARTERLTTLGALRTLLDGGQPLGAALPRLGGTPPEALARYATAAPPTEAALRLSFEEAVRQARAATQSQETLTSRLNSLLTVRRGDEVIWGDSSEVQIERARRALEAGDIDGAVVALARLPEANRAALRGWTAEAEALVAARAALRTLAAG